MRTRLISLGKAAVAPVLAVLFCFLPASAVAAVDDNEAVALITKFYQNFFHEKSDYASEDATIDALCSDNLKKKLRDAYEYDYEGSVAPYATWLFTTGAQDGPGDSKFVGAAAVGGGEYRADYYDMGIKAASVLKVVETAGGLKIDDVKCVEGGEADGDDGGIVDEPAPVWGRRDAAGRQHQPERAGMEGQARAAGGRGRIQLHVRAVHGHGHAAGTRRCGQPELLR